jgi:alkanesulfonate monooxygenase SsuD/methylene tetrahydromethanopterin reductase-like flavin-dependent oxidoreductase (luciferase family)
MSDGRRFRFGAVAAFGRTAQEWAATAQRVERLGFSTLLCPDTTGTFAPFQALAAAAGATSTLRLGSYVLASPFRTPGAVAWETASLDDAVRGVQQPRPPVLLAGSGPRMLRLAAREADILALGLRPQTTEDDLAAKSDQLRKIAGDEAFDRLELNVNIALVGDEIPPHAAAWLGAEPQELIRNGSITVLLGTPREMADTLLRRRDSAAVSYISVNGQFAERFAPVIELLADA